MADILSQEEINALLEILDEDEEFVTWGYKVSSIDGLVRKTTSDILEHEAFIKVDFQQYCRMKNELDNYKTLLKFIRDLKKDRQC